MFTDKDEESEKKKPKALPGYVDYVSFGQTDNSGNTGTSF